MLRIELRWHGVEKQRFAKALNGGARFAKALHRADRQSEGGAEKS